MSDLRDPGGAPGTRWVVGTRRPVEEVRLVKELGVSPLVAAILVHRGFADPESAERFLNPKLSYLHPPSLLPDYRPAVDAILGARERKELIFVHGDYDVDGVTSAAIFSRFLAKIGCQVHTHVPHRIKEGYGIHRSLVEEAGRIGAKLFLTCDCGISAYEQVAQAKLAGMTVVVTDHHTVGVELPEADAVVNPHRTDSEYPFDELSGAGVVFKLCQGIAQELGIAVENYHRAYLDLAALGTIADVMPLVDENRIIAKFGLQQLADSKKEGIRALLRQARIETIPGQPLRSRQVGWQLGPRLNAAGRIDDSALSLELLLESDPEKAEMLAEQLEAINSARKIETTKVVDAAAERAEAEGAASSNVIIVVGEDWHPGIVGIAAGRLVERFYRPCLVGSTDPETGISRCSARSIPGFDLAQMIRKNPGLFLGGGGHAMAAGCSFETASLPEIRSRLNDYAASVLTPEDLRPTRYADLAIQSDEISLASVQGLEALEPFGNANEEPTLVCRDVAMAEIRPTRNPIHVQLTLKTPDQRNVAGIGFSMGPRFANVAIGEKIDVLFKPKAEEYQGRTSLKWQVEDFTAAGQSDDSDSF